MGTPITTNRWLVGAGLSAAVALGACSESPSSISSNGLSDIEAAELANVIVDDAVKIFPNPPWEELVTIVTVPVGSYIIIDELHLATECVPEPATMSLLALGGFGILRRRRNRKNA